MQQLNFIFLRGTSVEDDRPTPAAIVLLPCISYGSYASHAAAGAHASLWCHGVAHEADKSNSNLFVSRIVVGGNKDCFGLREFSSHHLTGRTGVKVEICSITYATTAESTAPHTAQRRVSVGECANLLKGGARIGRTTPKFYKAFEGILVSNLK